MIRDNRGKRKKLPKNLVDAKKPPHPFGKPSRLPNESHKLMENQRDQKRISSGEETRQ
jgi:hypothetical protein